MKINKLTNSSIPLRLRQLPDAPSVLYSSLFSTQLESLLTRHCVAIVGSRKVTTYGRHVTQDLASKLAARGIVIISGLALGVDAIAHQAALEAGGLSIAVLPSPLETVYPASHRQLASALVARGGGLVSEYPVETPVRSWSFIARNRLIAGLADATVITEAAEKSGSLHTAAFALDQGRVLLAIPGNITSPTSTGTNNLIKAGAGPVTSYRDVLQALGVEDNHAQPEVTSDDPAEQAIITLVAQGVHDGEQLQAQTRLDAKAFNQALTMLELAGKVRSLGANQWSLS